MSHTIESGETKAETIPCVTRWRIDTVLVSWDVAVIRGPYKVTITPKNEAEAARWRMILTPYPTSEQDGALEVVVEHLALLGEVFKLVGKISPQEDIMDYLQDHIRCCVKNIRSNVARNLMLLKSLIPPLPRNVEQDVSLHQPSPQSMWYQVSMMVTQGSRNYRIPLYENSWTCTRTITTFTSNVPAIRWDKLDYVLETFHTPPRVTVEERR